MLMLCPQHFKCYEKAQSASVCTISINATLHPHRHQQSVACNHRSSKYHKRCYTPGATNPVFCNGSHCVVVWLGLRFGGQGRRSRPGSGSRRKRLIMMQPKHVTTRSDGHQGLHACRGSMQGASWWSMQTRVVVLAPVRILVQGED